MAACRRSIVGVLRRGLTPAGYRRVTLFALVAVAFIIVTGGAVRLTGSGLGCPDWPTCANDRIVAPLEYHPMIEFVNRTVTGAVSVAVILAVLGSLVRRPRRRDLVVLSVGLVAGVVGQIVLGGLTVLFELAPQLVMSHFLLSMVLLFNAVVLHHRAGQPEGPPVAVVAPVVARVVRLVLGAAAVVVFTGTIVTASGPHGGDEEVRRLGFALGAVARVHGTAVFLLLGSVVAALVLARRTGAPAGVQRQGTALLGVLVAQAAVGYAQYFTGVPALLVGVHILGAVLVWVAAVRFNLVIVERAAPALVPSALRRPSSKVLAAT